MKSNLLGNNLQINECEKLNNQLFYEKIENQYF